MRPRVVTFSSLLLLGLWVFFQIGSGREQAHATATTASSSSHKPWRKYDTTTRTTNKSFSRDSSSMPLQHDYTKHFLDFEQVQKDPNARIYQVNLRSRKPGKLSWTSRIGWANILCYGAQTYSPAFTQWGIKLSERILRGQELYRLITPVFLHGGLGHLFTNMYSLNAVGREVENLFGKGRFVATYLAAGVAGNLASAIQSPNPSLGASGAVFGIFGAYYVFLNRNEWLLGSAGQQMSGRLTQTLGMNVLLGFVNPMIDNWGHIGGALGGAAMAYYFGPRLYLSELPNGGRIVVDRPVMRLPRKLEVIPEKMGELVSSTTRLLKMERLSPGPQKETAPWQQTRESYRTRLMAPNRSIKPQI